MKCDECWETSEKMKIRDKTVEIIYMYIGEQPFFFKLCTISFNTVASPIVTDY